MSPAIIFENVSKRYDLRAGQGTLRDAIPALARRLFRRHSNPSSDRPQSAHEIWALRDVSFEVQPGEALGIIGANGAGKTTALSLLAGITRPTAGRIAVAGRVGALIQLGAGFHPELTGRENVYLNASILGLKKAEVDRIYDDIVAFAELEEFMDTPIKRYSSGMYVRLGFAVAIHIDPDVLLVDEVLAVGDMNFRMKSQRRMRDLLSKGHTVVLVSHNMAAIRSLCQRVLWLDSGRIMGVGAPHEVIARYADEMNRRALNTVGAYLNTASRRGTGEIRFTKVETLDSEGRPCNKFAMGALVRIRTCYRVSRSVEAPRFGFGIRHGATGVVVTSASWQSAGGGIGSEAGQTGVVECTFGPLTLCPGSYSLYLGIGDQHRRVSFDVWDGAGADFVVTNEGLVTDAEFMAGYDTYLVMMPHRFSYAKNDDIP